MQAEPRLFLPFMRPLYQRLASFSYPLIRLAVAGAVLVHGIGKLTTGPAPVIANMARYGFQPAEPIAYLIIFLETVGAACVIVGLFTRFFAFALFIESLVIAFGVQSSNGFFANRNGYE